MARLIIATTARMPNFRDLLSNFGALARGVAFSRPAKMGEDQKELARELVKNGQSVAAVARTFNVHPVTIYRCIDDPAALSAAGQVDRGPAAVELRHQGVIRTALTPDLVVAII